MRSLTIEDLQTLDEYERGREEFRRRIIELKRNRRITVGDRITLVFENRETLFFQIQEMLRVERIVDPEKIKNELETYNQLMPSAGELSATLFIEITDAAQVKDVLDRFQGIDRGKTVSLRVGPHLVYGTFEQGYSKEDKISAVHFVRFSIPERVKAEMSNLQARMELRVNHEDYQAAAAIPDDMRFSLLNDLEEI